LQVVGIQRHVLFVKRNAFVRQPVGRSNPYFVGLIVSRILIARILLQFNNIHRGTWRGGLCQEFLGATTRTFSTTVI
jgi:hypothetical protein